VTAFPFAIVGFDLDGTLCDTAPDLGAAINHVLAVIGRAPVSLAEVRNLVGGGSRLMLRRALALTGGEDGVDSEALYMALLEHYEAHIADHSRPYPGCLDALDVLAGHGVRLAVVTNKPERLALKLLDTLDLATRFACVIGGGSAGIAAPKPAPDPLLAMRARLGAQRAAFVGDSSFDVRAARAAAIPVVAVRFGYADLQPEHMGADRIIDHYRELAPALVQLGE
jgi:phosphoglycolate phosphatase